jgi:tetratricopeptide (TPR) repeat protein
MRLVLALLFGSLITLSAARAESSCGEPPLVADQTFKASTQGAVQLLRGFIGQANLEARIETARTDVFSKFPNADKARERAYFAYVFCVNVLSDPRLSPQQKAQYAVLIMPDDPAVAQAKQQALKAISSGDYDRAGLLATAALNQIGAVLLIDDGHPDLAIGNLQQAERLLDNIHTENSAKDQVQRAYIYKTYAQGFAAKGELKQEQHYFDLALKTFEQVKNDPNLDGKTTNEFGSAINGIGNIHYQRGQYRESIADYKLATSLLPTYAYAWHDMFLAYFQLAKQGDVDLPAMRNALERTKETGAGWPGLDAKTITLLESMLAQFER